MKLEYINEFVTLAEVGNYLRASQQLFIAQSALSRHIQLMEEELGIKLFDRTTRSLELTECGKVFLPYAREMLETQYKYTTALYNRMNDLQETITIGCLPVPAPYGIPEIIAKFAKENSQFAIELTKTDSIDQLYNGAATFVFIRQIGEPRSNLIYIPFNSDSLVAVLPQDHKYANYDVIGLNMLSAEKFLFLQKHTQMHDLCVESCRMAGFEPQIVYSGSYAGNILALAREHTGVALLTKKPLLEQDLSGLKLVTIIPEVKTPICLVYLKEKKLSIAASHFLSCTKAYLNRGSVLKNN